MHYDAKVCMMMLFCLIGATKATMFCSQNNVVIESLSLLRVVAELAVAKLKNKSWHKLLRKYRA